MISQSSKYWYFIGIGGIGMSALARYYANAGCIVAGYDKTPTTLTKELMQEGINIHFEDEIRLVSEDLLKNPEQATVVFTPAVPKDHKELNYFIDKGFKVIKRSVALGNITKNSNTIGVAGTHGKTTTSSLMTHVLKVANLNVSAFLGGITQNYNNNFIIGDIVKGNNITVVEADEYDRSFLTLHPTTAIVTSVDADHLDIYNDSNSMLQSYQDYVNQIREGGLFIKKLGLPLTTPANCKGFTYSYDATKADYYASNIRVENGAYVFELIGPGINISNVQFGIPGLHNIENSVAVFAVAHQMGVSADSIKESFKSFKGVKRRFEYYLKKENIILIDDYAHHPTELKACIGSARHLYPNHRITGVFQPHLFSRTRDFMDDFADSLSMVDELILLDIYPARELPIEGITSASLLEKIKINSKKLVSKENLATTLAAQKPQLVLMMGAGDIDQLLIPVKEALDHV